MKRLLLRLRARPHSWRWDLAALLVLRGARLIGAALQVDPDAILAEACSRSQLATEARAWGDRSAT